VVPLDREHKELRLTGDAAKTRKKKGETQA